jgi:Prokaryotic N-terminal methylation motif
MSQYKKQKAISLIEVLISIVIATLIMQGFTRIFVTAWTANKFSLETGLASSIAQRANNKIVIDLRGVQQSENGKYPLETANSFDLVLYSDIEDDGVVERVHYYLDQASDEMRVGVRNPDTSTQPPTYAAGDETTTVLSKYIINTNSDPVFAYYADNYPQVVTPLSVPADVSKIQLVQVKLLVNIDPILAPNNIAIESFVDLRNLHNYE